MQLDDGRDTLIGNLGSEWRINKDGRKSYSDVELGLKRQKKDETAL